MAARVLRAAVDYAEGRPVDSAPPSLRVFAILKHSPSAFPSLDLLTEDSLLLAEFEVYAAEEARVAAEAHARAERRSQSGSGRGRGLFRGRRR